MAKINHNNYLDTIDVMYTDAKNNGVMHLTSNDGAISGRMQIGSGINIDGSF